MINFLSYYLHLTRRERTGLLVIYPTGLVLMLCTWYLDERPLSDTEVAGYEYARVMMEARHAVSAVADSFPIQAKPPAARPEKQTRGEPIDINLSDTVLWQSLRGIGPVLSRRAIAYRDLLGGYVHTDQVREVYGIDSSLYKSLKNYLYVSEGFIPEKINISRAGYRQLRAHPYIEARQASAIIHYRSQHGDFYYPKQLYAIHKLDSGSILRLLPYLEFSKAPVESVPGG